MATVNHDAGDALSHVVLQEAELADVEHPGFVVEALRNRAHQGLLDLGRGLAGSCGKHLAQAALPYRSFSFEFFFV